MSFKIKRKRRQLRMVEEFLRGGTVYDPNDHPVFRMTVEFVRAVAIGAVFHCETNLGLPERLREPMYQLCFGLAAGLATGVPRISGAVFLVDQSALEECVEFLLDHAIVEWNERDWLQLVFRVDGDDVVFPFSKAVPGPADSTDDDGSMDEEYLERAVAGARNFARWYAAQHHDESSLSLAGGDS
jgi:hypothetical protein